MKNLTILAFVLISFASKAQLEDISTKLDGHVGYSAPLGNNYPISGGPNINVEPKFWYNEQIVVGAKLGVSFLKAPTSGVKLVPLTSIMLVGEKYMGEGDLTFFVGASAGLYLGGNIKNSGSTARAAQQWGLAPRAGLQFGQYRLMVEYNIRKTAAKFLSFNIGYTFGSSE
jgi:hypothetical protein